MRGAEAIDEYVALPEQEAFDIEYWQLEKASSSACRQQRRWRGAW
jgi:rhamnose utilization protein RhaD (predicted bifunctional aldolase and dehydrogenase)